MRIFLLTALLAATSAAAQAPAAPDSACKQLAPAADDALVASPANHTVLFEDVDVRVLDVHSKPHTREAVHTHRLPSVMYIDRQGAGTYDTPDGSDHRSHPTDADFKPVIRAIKPEGPHWTENTGEVPFHAIRVELKHPGCGLPGWKPATPGPDDALTAAPATNTLLLENADVRVIDVHLAPHAKDTLHTYPWPGFFYVVQPALVHDLSAAATRPQLRDFSTGSKIMPAAAGVESFENTGDTPLHLIRFELKYAQPSQQ